MIVKYLLEILPCCYERNKYPKKEDYTRCGVCRKKKLKKNFFLHIVRFNTDICSYVCHIKWLHLKNHTYDYNSNHKYKKIINKINN